MILGGFIAAIIAALVILVNFFGSLNMFSDMASMGILPWIDRFFANINSKKIVFMLAVVVFVVGVVYYLIGRNRAKKKGEKVPFVPAALTKYFRDTRGEFKKVVWPTFPAVVRNTGVTLVVCALLGAAVCLVDFGLSALIDLLLKIGG
ncbi:MAG: preprotein translocase subunit SecE [Clostridia bacterium]|nr:preprotein translocase subunit SecE [Clostridia bacterium]